MQIGDKNSCTIQQQADQASKGETPQQIKDHVARLPQERPTPPGPWPFLVYNTLLPSGAEYGLKVKTAPSVTGQQVGSASSGSVVWADCYVFNSFNPEVGTDADVGPKWLRIHWPANAPGTAFALSSPTDSFLAYVYAGYTLPFTHNGQIPICT